MWHPDEYIKLMRYDQETPYQPVKVFTCHRHLDRVCGGWAGCHDTDHLLALRMAPHNGTLAPAELAATIDYVSPIQLFGSGTAAARHGLAPFADAAARRRSQRIIDKVVTQRGVGEGGWLLLNHRHELSASEKPDPAGDDEQQGRT